MRQAFRHNPNQQNSTFAPVGFALARLAFLGRPLNPETQQQPAIRQPGGGEARAQAARPPRLRRSSEVATGPDRGTRDQPEPTPQLRPPARRTSTATLTSAVPAGLSRKTDTHRAGGTRCSALARTAQRFFRSGASSWSSSTGSASSPASFPDALLIGPPRGRGWLLRAGFRFSSAELSENDNLHGSRIYKTDTKRERVF